MAQYGPYHRTGDMTGSGCPVAVLPISIKQADGSFMKAKLLDAGDNVTELDLLRTLLASSPVKWGHDDLGWWAVVPD